MICLKAVSQQTHSKVLLHFPEKFSSPRSSGVEGGYFNFCEKANRRIFAFAGDLYLPLLSEIWCICHFGLNIFATLVWIFSLTNGLYLPILFEYVCNFVWIFAFADDIYLPLLFELWCFCHFGLNIFATFVSFTNDLYLPPLLEYICYFCLNICFCWRSLFATFIWILIYLPLWSEYVCHFCLNIFPTFVWIFAFSDNLYLPFYLNFDLFATLIWICLPLLLENISYLCLNICFFWQSLFATFICTLIYLPLLFLLLKIYIYHLCLNIFVTSMWIFAFTDNLYLPLLFELWYICQFFSFTNNLYFHYCLNIFVTSIWIFAFADDLYLPLLFCLLLFRQCRLSRGHSTKWDSGYFTLSNFIKLALFDLIAITQIP